MLKENGCQESFIGKVFKRITNNHSLSQSQQQTKVTEIQEEETRMSKNLPDGDDTIEKLRRILRSLKIRSILYPENTFRKLLCKPKNGMATESKINIAYDIDCSNCEAIFFRKSKPYLNSCSHEHKRSAKNCDCEKNETAKHCREAGIKRKLLIGKIG